MNKFKLTISGLEVIVYQDSDGKFIIPEQFRGIGTALKPAVENWILCRKPISEKTVAANVLKHGCGGINIDASRIGTETIKTQGGDKFPNNYGEFKTCPESFHQGRFPANLILDEEAGAMLDAQSGDRPVSGSAKLGKPHEGEFKAGFLNKAGQRSQRLSPNDSGGASRFFKNVGPDLEGNRFIYCAKTSKSEKNEGCESLPSKKSGGMSGTIDSTLLTGSGNVRDTNNNNHPTVKPQKLMSYLIKMITPPHGVILDPFTGSGSTGVSALKEGFSFLGIERESEYINIAEARLSHAQKGATQNGKISNNSDDSAA